MRMEICWINIKNLDPLLKSTSNRLCELSEGLLISWGISFLFHKWRELSWVSSINIQTTNGHSPPHQPVPKTDMTITSGHHFPLSANYSSNTECHTATPNQLQLAQNKMYLPPFGPISSQIYSNSILSVQSQVLNFVISLLEEKWNGLLWLCRAESCQMQSPGWW